MLNWAAGEGKQLLSGIVRKGGEKQNKKGKTNKSAEMKRGRTSGEGCVLWTSKASPTAKTAQ